MPLTLTIRPNDRTAQPAPVPLRLDRRGATIGRAPTCDWVLPDDRATISSRHCMIAFDGAAYVITDSSTNGTAINGTRLSGPQRLNDGDVIGIGPYDIAVAVRADAAPPPAAPTMSPGAARIDGLRAAGASGQGAPSADPATPDMASQLLRAFAAGTAMLLEQRDRARAEIGLPPAASRPAAMAVAPLLGNATSAQQVADAFADLDAHQLATLKAMQGAMKATLDLYAPAAIRARAGAKADEAALWREYERAFTASDQGFADAFAREFRAAFDALARRRSRR
jgi:predicted component of type VI protein secretion system